jgi:tripartite-type tricarboxylate transporter receptor subunit TctC
VIFFLFMGRCLIKQSGIHLASAMILCSISAAIASAAEYPTKTIQIINPFPPGAVTDIVARIAAPKLSTLLGQQVIIVNKSGGGGAVGIQAARDAAPDGYTILITPPPILLIPLVNKNSGFTMKDFTPLVLATSSPNTTVVKADAPWKTLEDFIADAKKKSGRADVWLRRSRHDAALYRRVGQAKNQDRFDACAARFGIGCRNGCAWRPREHRFSDARDNAQSH